MPKCLQDCLWAKEEDLYLPLDRVDITKQPLSGSQHYHENCIMHRDIKPDNVMMGVVEGDGKSARWLCKFTDHGAVKVTRQLVAGQAGSPFYCAPEILDRKPYGERVDVWSLGVLSVVLFTGHDPIRDNPYVDIYPQSSSEVRGWMNLVSKFIKLCYDPKWRPLLNNMLMEKPLKRWPARRCQMFMADPSQPRDRIVSILPALSSKE
ncbi:uncharacterized protein PV07_08729 [Cladophialophora immunda]|uniref:Protein kinase domain-containing protein n=1 Tax=Cladophialophora immunda TaxID=569365 RepID=A0A0D2AKS1_9EURO|nr:uncharacterized protein PV07_08729 [Cladophialophora immunda]KIW25562.1 hypothetical protein PV07_08729 [Cladophialophora immunda]